MIRTVAVAVASTSPASSRSSPAGNAMDPPRWITRPCAGDPAGSGRAQEADLQLQGRRELALAQGGSERGAELVVEHGGQKPALYVAHRIGGKAEPYLSVKGVRDIASGLIAVILLAARMPHVLGWFELAASTIPIGDAIIVLRSNDPEATAYGVHGAGAVVLLATAALLFT
jgi:hypothetical protein